MLLLILFFALMFITIAAMLWSGVELFREQEDPLGDRLVDLQAHAMVGATQAPRRSRSPGHPSRGPSTERRLR